MDTHLEYMEAGRKREPRKTEIDTEIDLEIDLEIDTRNRHLN